MKTLLLTVLSPGKYLLQYFPPMSNGFNVLGICRGHSLKHFDIYPKCIISSHNSMRNFIGKLLSERCDQTIHFKIKGQLNISDMNQENVELLEKRTGYVKNYVIKYAITMRKPVSQDKSNYNYIDVILSGFTRKKIHRLYVRLIVNGLQF